MKTYDKIQAELAANGYNWPPRYKSIEQKIWPQMIDYIDEDEAVLSILWCSYSWNNQDMIGLILITSKRVFTLEVVDDNTSKQIRYLPFDSFSLNKIQIKNGEKDGSNVTFVNLCRNENLDSNQSMFACPNKNVVDHFVNTLLKNFKNLEIEELPEVEDPQISENKNEQILNENLNQAKEKKPHVSKKNENEKFEENKSKFWRKTSSENYKKEIEIKKVPKKEFNQDKKSEQIYGSKMHSKIWMFLFLIPLVFICSVILIIFAI